LPTSVSHCNPVGLSAGFFAGMSNTPVVGVLLPLLFALVGGTGGLYLANAPLDSAIAIQRIGVIGKGLCVLSIACLLGALSGIGVRVGINLSPSTLTTLGSSEPAQALEVLALRSRLKILEASETDETNILKHAAADFSDFNIPLPLNRLNDILQKADDLIKIMDSGIPSFPPSLSQFNEHLGKLRTILDLVKTQPPSGMVILNADLYKKQISALLKDMSPVLDDSDATIKAWLNAPSRLSQAFVAFFLLYWESIRMSVRRIGSSDPIWRNLSSHPLTKFRTDRPLDR
jgi:hypothetical protein